MEILDTLGEEALRPMFLAAARWPPAATSAMRVHPIVRKFAKRHAENQITIKWAEEGTVRGSGDDADAYKFYPHISSSIQSPPMDAHAINACSHFHVNESSNKSRGLRTWRGS